MMGLDKIMEAFEQMQTVMQKLDAAKIKEIEAQAHEFFERAVRIENKLDRLLKAIEDTEDGDSCDSAASISRSTASGS